MKKLMVYFAVIVGCLFVGLTTYYLLKDYDIFTISQNGLAVEAENDIYLNRGQTSTLEINIDKKSDDTELAYSFDTEGVASFDLETGKITALKGGATKLKIYTNKDALGFFEFNISVADGTSDYAWYIFSAEDLKSIGEERNFGTEQAPEIVEWSFEDSYQLMNDIDLAGRSWKPLGLNEWVKDDCLEANSEDFKGEFNGNGFKIKNLKIEGEHIFAGLFASMSDSANFENVIFENVNISGYFMYAGTVAGYSEGASIEKVEVAGGNIKLLATKTAMPYDVNFVGGIIGFGITNLGTEVVATNSISLCTFDGTIEIDKDAAATTLYAVGGLCGSGCGVELINNKSTLDLKIKDYVEKSGTTLNNSFGGVVGTSYCDPIDFSKELTEEAQNINYSMIINNLSIFSYDAVNGNMGGVVGQRSIKSVLDKDIAKYLAGNSEKTQDVNNLLKVVNASIYARISGNIYANKTENVVGDLKQYEGIIEHAYVDLTSKTTFENQNWTISSIDAGESTAWVIDGDNVPQININGINSTTDYSQKYIELTQSNFAEYVEKMLNSTGATARYWLSREYKLKEDIDLSTINAFKDSWTAIFGKNSDLSFSGVFDGDGHSISNLKIVNVDDKGNASLESVGLFSTISTTGVVKNLKLINVDIDYADYAGAIAGINFGTITNCQVEAVHINNAKTAGFVVGHNEGTIETTNKDDKENLVYTVLADTEAANKISSEITDKSVFLGGVAGYNKGKIIGVRIEANFELTGKKADNSAITKMIGGIAGYNGGEIESCAVEGATIKDNSTVFTYLGGIAGLTNGNIKSSYAGSTGDGLSVSINGNVEENNIMIGGIAGQISIGAEVEKCYVKADLKGYYIGGVAANLFGTVKECYILGSFEGDRVGGISVNVSISDKQEKGGDVKDCYVGATLKGYTSDAKAAGLSVYIVRPGKFENVIVSAIFTGEGDKYYESYTDTRVSFFNFFKKINGTQLGHVYNIVIDDSLNDKTVKKNGGAINYEGQSAYYTDTATIQSGESYFIEKGYNVSEDGVWLMEPQKAPLLRNLNLATTNAEANDEELTDQTQTEQTETQNTETQNTETQA